MALFNSVSEELFSKCRLSLVANHTLSLLSRITSFKAHKEGETYRRVGVCKGSSTFVGTSWTRVLENWARTVSLWGKIYLWRASCRRIR